MQPGFRVARKPPLSEISENTHAHKHTNNSRISRNKLQSHGSVMAKRFKHLVRNDQHSDALKDKNNVVGGARDPDQMSRMSIPSASSSSMLAISSHSSTATLHGGLVHVHARQVNAHPHVAYEDMTAEEKMAWRIRVMDMDESDGCIDWLHLAPIDHEQPLCALESSSSINVSATTPAVTSNKEKEREMVIKTDDCSIDCLNL